MTTPPEDPFCHHWDDPEAAPKLPRVGGQSYIEDIDEGLDLLRWRRWIDGIVPPVEGRPRPTDDAQPENPSAEVDRLNVALAEALSNRATLVVHTTAALANAEAALARVTAERDALLVERDEAIKALRSTTVYFEEQARETTGERAEAFADAAEVARRGVPHYGLLAAPSAPQSETPDDRERKHLGSKSKLLAPSAPHGAGWGVPDVSHPCDHWHGGERCRRAMGHGPPHTGRRDGSLMWRDCATDHRGPAAPSAPLPPTAEQLAHAYPDGYQGPSTPGEHAAYRDGLRHGAGYERQPWLLWCGEILMSVCKREDGYPDVSPGQNPYCGDDECTYCALARYSEAAHIETVRRKLAAPSAPQGAGPGAFEHAVWLGEYLRRHESDALSGQARAHFDALVHVALAASPSAPHGDVAVVRHKTHDPINRPCRCGHSVHSHSHGSGRCDACPCKRWEQPQDIAPAAPSASQAETFVGSGREHKLKTWPPYFDGVVDGSKTFEVRLEDRPFAVGDVLALREWDPKAERYTGRTTRRRITYLMRGGRFGLERGYVVLGLATASAPQGAGPVAHSAPNEPARVLGAATIHGYPEPGEDGY